MSKCNPLAKAARTPLYAIVQSDGTVLVRPAISGETVSLQTDGTVALSDCEGKAYIVSELHIEIVRPWSCV